METRVEANIDVEMIDIETQAEITTATRLQISFFGVIKIISIGGGFKYV